MLPSQMGDDQTYGLSPIFLFVSYRSDVYVHQYRMSAISLMSLQRLGFTETIPRQAIKGHSICVNSLTYRNYIGSLASN